MGTSNGHGSTSNKNVGIEKKLAVKLTEKELLDRGNRAADCEIEIAALKAERSNFTRAINEQASKRAQLLGVIDAKEEERMVLCHWAKNFAHNCWDLIRSDTRAVVDTKPLTAADRQAEIEFPTEPDAIQSELDEHKVDMPTGGAPRKTNGKRKPKVTTKGKSKPKDKPPEKPSSSRRRFATTAI